MTKLPKAVLALVIVALIAVVAGVSVVATVAWLGHSREARRAQSVAVINDLDKAIQEYAEAGPGDLPETALPADPDAPTPAPGETAELTDIVDAVVMDDRPAHLSHFVPETDSPPDGDEPRRPVRFAFGPGAGGSKHLGNLPAANAAARLSLSAGQRAAIEQFEEAFKQQVDARLLPVEQKIDQAKAAYQQAWQSGSQELKDSSRDALTDAAREQSAILSELGKEYVEGVKPYLSDEQAAQLEKTAGQPVPTVVGIAQSGDGPPEVSINQGGASAITIIAPEHPPDGGPPPEEE